MAIVVTFELEGATQDVYDACIDRITGGRGFSAVADLPKEAAGLIAHVSGPVEGGWRVTDVWESAEAFESFAAVLAPIVSDLGFGHVQPQVTPAHNVVIH
ncbi:hypothetical protein [Streptomyces cinnamoneus]|uniref:Antibiotic biosynthesis monooxygenase n=1 Tax=Streptomyces cinnamoneus TaxID=53446 RepID=A0A918TYL8_STRCJ|nr:hypothetical protein [Streptomyces cinnamoneus]GHC67933.1 hypothetical protein GCM10010507_52690 [Streptomyces cinnamoneus]